MMKEAKEAAWEAREARETAWVEYKKAEIVAGEAYEIYKAMREAASEAEITFEVARDAAKASSREGKP